MAAFPARALGARPRACSPPRDPPPPPRRRLVRRPPAVDQGDFWTGGESLEISYDEQEQPSKCPMSTITNSFCHHPGILKGGSSLKSFNIKGTLSTPQELLEGCRGKDAAVNLNFVENAITVSPSPRRGLSETVITFFHRTSQGPVILAPVQKPAPMPGPDGLQVTNWLLKRTFTTGNPAHRCASNTRSRGGLTPPNKISTWLDPCAIQVLAFECE